MNGRALVEELREERNSVTLCVAGRFEGRVVGKAAIVAYLAEQADEVAITTSNFDDGLVLNFVPFDQVDCEFPVEFGKRGGEGLR